MSTTVPTIFNSPATATDPVLATEPANPVAGLTSLVSLALTARARLRLSQEDRALALADLEEALRHDPGNYEAIELRDQIQGKCAGAEPGSTGPVDRSVPEGDGSRMCYRAGYQVMSHHPNRPRVYGVPLGAANDHTALGRSHAIEYAKHMCIDESSREREMLYDGHLTSSEVFDAVVVEVRSLVREIHVERGHEEDDGESLVAKDSES